jgi:hypothetical protein
LFGIDWLRNGIPIAKETSVLEDESEAVADAKRRAAARVVQRHPGGEPDSFRLTDPTGRIRGVFLLRRQQANNHANYHELAGIHPLDRVDG